MTKVAVLVPRRADGGRRDDLWAYIRDTRWDGYTIFEGHDDTGGWFNRSRAINLAAQAAGDWDVAIIADSDSFVGPDQLETAVEGCERYGKMWLAYSVFHYLTQSMSDRIMGGYVGNWEPGVRFTMTNTCSSMVVVRRDIWDKARGFDEGFVGWGMEDVAASHAFQTFGGGLAKAVGPCWHLWHAPSTERTPEHDAELLARAERYHQAHGDEALMTALLDELR
jgi:GT2 family glycosyltransferase